MRIGEVATASGVSTKAIRYYESIGLLSEPPRTNSGYRDYDAATVQRIGFVRASQRAGLTLAEIRTVIEISDEGQTPCSHVTNLIDNKLIEIKKRLQALERTRSELQELKHRAGTLRSEDCGPESICHILEPISDDGRAAGS